MRNLRESLRDVREQIRLFIEQLRMYPSAIFGLAVITLLVAGSLYALIALPYEEIGMDFNHDRVRGRNLAPRTAAPAWTNLFRTPPYLSALILDEQSTEANVTEERLENGWIQKTVTFTFDYRYKEFPSDVFLYLDNSYNEKLPFVSLEWLTPDGRTIDLKAKAVGGVSNYDLQTGISVRRLLVENPEWKNWFVETGQYTTPAYKLLFAKPGSQEAVPQHGTYKLKVTSLLFEEASDVEPQLVLLGQVYGAAGTDLWRQDLVVPLFWGMPITLMVGFIGMLITTLVAMLLPAIGVWFGGWPDNLIQRLTEVNMVLPGLAMAVLINALFGVHIWIILAIVVVLNALGAPIKSFRSALLQAKEAPYIEMARSYGASNFRIITHYLVPRILPVLIPHLVMQIPTFIFLEATLGFFNVHTVYPSWGRIIYQGLSRGDLYGSPFWVLQPIFLLLLTGLAFAMLGSALERILNPRIITDIPVESKKLEAESKKSRSDQRKEKRFRLDRTVLVGLMILLIIVAFIPFIRGNTFASALMGIGKQSQISNSPTRMTPATTSNVPNPSSISLPTEVFASPTEPLPSSTPTATSSPTVTSTATPVTLEPTLTPLPTNPQPETYMLQRGEYPYCIARRFNVDPTELLVLNRMQNRQTFYTGMVLQMPQNGDPFPGERMQKAHPTIHTVSSSNETMYTIACEFGDVQPLAIAQANNLHVDSALYIGQQLNIP
jgi:peptide/nickel transport system permease protein